MLAYVFWHSASPGTDPQEYRQRLHTFHRQLRDTPPTGFLVSYTWHVGNVPWLPGADTYEDWYLLDSASSLDVLAEAAVSHQLGSVHDHVADLAASGIAGLYKPARGKQAAADGARASWFSRPTGTSYEDLYGYLREQDSSIADRLWQRFLTLGPTPEFCLVGSDAIDLPAEYAPLVVTRNALAAE